MEAINYLLVFFVGILGYVLGVGLGYIAPEELKPGKKYFIWLERILFVLTFLPIIYFFRESFLVLLPAILLLILLFIPFKYRAYAAFGVFLIWFFLIRSDSLVVMLEASAIFLYGLPAGTLLKGELSPTAVAELNKKVKR